MYDTYETAEGEFARYGDILYASLSVGGKKLPIYRYEMQDGHIDYFEPDGHSIRKTLMKTADLQWRNSENVKNSYFDVDFMSKWCSGTL